MFFTVLRTSLVWRVKLTDRKPESMKNIFRVRVLEFDFFFFLNFLEETFFILLEIKCTWGGDAFLHITVVFCVSDIKSQLHWLNGVASKLVQAFKIAIQLLQRVLIHLLNTTKHDIQVTKFETRHTFSKSRLMMCFCNSIFFDLFNGRVI